MSSSWTIFVQTLYFYQKDFELYNQLYIDNRYICRSQKENMVYSRIDWSILELTRLAVKTRINTSEAFLGAGQL